MNLLARVRDQFHSMTQPAKAISHRPDLVGREHLYRQGANTIVQAMDTFADYATVYSVYTWVQKAISLIANNLAALPVRVVDAKDKAIEGHPLTLLLANVNDEETPVDLWNAYTVHKLLGGETFYQIVPDGRGRPVELWLRRPDRVSVVPDSTRLEYPTAIGYLYESEETPSQPIAIDAPWMVHDKFYNPLNPWRGLAPINAVREGITIDMFAQSWSKRFLRNSARPDFAIVAPQGITQSERDRYYEQFMLKHQGASNAHLPVILEEGVTDIKTFAFPPKDIEWLQQREFARDEVGAIFGVPDEIMGYGKDTYENFQTALEVFWTLTLLPMTMRRDSTLTHHFRRYGLGLEAGQRIATDLSSVGVLQEDLTPKVDLARKFWEMGVPFNTLDKTLALGVGPVEGGDVGYLPSALTTVDLITNPPPPPAPMLPPNAPAGNDEPPAEDEPEDEEPPVARLYLPDGAKEQAKRALKKIIQEIQDAHLRAIRAGEVRQWPQVDLVELRRWLGDDASAVADRIQVSVHAISGDHDTVNAAYTKLKGDAQIARLLEVAAPAFFTRARVRLPTGAITHDIYKALLLELDPDDDEAEQRIREEIERRFERRLTSAFREQLGDLLPSDASDDAIRAAPSQVAATSQPVREVVRRELEQSSSLGVTVALDTLGRVGLGFDWTLANTEAARWASQYSFELVQGINRTTQARLQQAVDDWFRERTTLPDLRRELEPAFGRQRARVIAQTETTRSSVMGSQIGYRQSGVVSQIEIRTARDERVCPICGPLHGTRHPLQTGDPVRGFPPFHVSCRCWIAPVVDTD